MLISTNNLETYDETVRRADFILVLPRLPWTPITTYFTTILIRQPLAEIVYSNILHKGNHCGTIAMKRSPSNDYISKRFSIPGECWRGRLQPLLRVVHRCRSRHVGWWLSEVQRPKVPLPPSRAAPSTYNLGRVNEIPGRSSLEEHSSSVSPCSLELRPRIPHRATLSAAPTITHAHLYTLKENILSSPFRVLNGNFQLRKRSRQ